jgi:hypothetical protein
MPSAERDWAIVRVVNTKQAIAIKPLDSLMNEGPAGRFHGDLLPLGVRHLPYETLRFICGSVV